MEIDEGGGATTQGWGGRISKPAAGTELVGITLTYGICAMGDVYVLNDNFCFEKKIYQRKLLSEIVNKWHQHG